MEKPNEEPKESIKDQERPTKHEQHVNTLSKK